MAVPLWLAAAVVSCAREPPPAPVSWQECRNACVHLAGLVAAANPPPGNDDPVARVEADFEKRLDALQAEVDRAVQPIDDELQAGQAATQDDFVRENLTLRYSRLKKARAEEFSIRFAALRRERDSAVLAARLAVMEAEAGQRARTRKAADLCADGCLAEGVTRQAAECRSRAATVGDFERCRVVSRSE